MAADVSDLRALAVDLRNDGPAAIPHATLVDRKIDAAIVGDAKVLSPVDTGFLENSIGSEVTVTDDAVEAVEGPTAEYGLYVEAGTSRMEPQPYMGPAFDRNIDQLGPALAARRLGGR